MLNTLRVVLNPGINPKEMDKDIYFDSHNNIDPTALIGPNVTLGIGNTIGAFTVIKGRVIIGNNNYIAPHVVIGEPGEYKTPPENACKNPMVIIGDNNRVSEFCAIQSSVLTSDTYIGSDNYIMHGCHIAHDCYIEDGVTIAPLTSLGGAVKVENYATFGQGVIVHPRKNIGIGAMIGMNATVTKDVPEWETWTGTPAKFLKMNERGMAKHGYKKDHV